MAYRDSTTASGNSDTPSVAVPAGVQIGDIVILVCAIDTASAVFDTADYPTGFTELHDVDGTLDGQSTSASWKRLTAADAGSYTFGNLGASGDWICQAVAFSGRHATNPPVAATAVTNNSSNSSPVTITANGVTAVDGDDLLWVSAPDVNNSGVGTGHTPPTNYTEREDAENAWANLSIATRDDVAAGATGNISGTFTMTGNNAGYAAFHIRIPEAAGAGGQTITATGIATEEAFGVPTLLAGAVSIAPNGIASLEAFGDPTITTLVTVIANAITSAEAFGDQTITSLVTIIADAIASAEAFGDAVLLTTVSLSPSGIASLEAFGDHTLAPGVVLILPAGIATEEIFGDALVSTGGLVVSPSGIATAEAFGDQVLIPGGVSVLPSGIASGEAFGNPTLQTLYAIVAQAIDSSEAFGDPSLNLGLLIIAPLGIPSAEAFGLVVILGGGTPAALMIDYRGFPVAWIDLRTIPVEWDDDETIDLG